ncbi:ABC transporter ATP-binding protein [Lacisediminihabitans changchengi]|uniref:ATP-binding cassette domain-containing protein n=1 Tax=Lacisediminihabitans changchengi TaxID=2787634 RepID=A0A934W3Y3_9MICO|nr:ATP-binding cassette domain-containing protein [Lacisediminihabitans changchengi]MBK4346950.1 ATP-binding cassette domain-containing protein [Lacisediminihabitans changchengi]MBK4347927.1 ATP-binding cassette domain-containing protein [Lacisediminihabitans changchengi]
MMHSRVTTDVAVRLAGVRIDYERPGREPLVVVDDLTLGLHAGSMHCIAGRSGSGKTSVLRVAAGLVPPTLGDVLWAGESIVQLRDDYVTNLRGASIGYLDQGGSLIPGLSALENVLLPAVPARRSTELAPHAAELMNRLGVWDRASSHPARLSGGERQRVALARALLLDPPVVMVDEPTAGLDRESADSVISILRDLVRDGKAVLVASHDERLIDAAESRTQLV